RSFVPATHLSNQGSIPEREPEKVAKLKLKGIDGRAPPGVEPAA
ncbi:hypothetical protein WH47_02933, partial [Habropoda laboriosa]